MDELSKTLNRQYIEESTIQKVPWRRQLNWKIHYRGSTADEMKQRKNPSSGTQGSGTHSNRAAK